MLAVADQLPRLGEERANVSAIVYLSLCGFCSERFPVPLGYCGNPCAFHITISRHYSNDAKDANILNRSGLPLNGG